MTLDEELKRQQDIASAKFDHNEKLWAALRTRVVTDEEMTEILAVGYQMVFSPTYWHSKENEERAVHVFNTALFRQALLRLEVAEARIRKLESMG
jgi:hypothetical protein